MKTLITKGLEERNEVGILKDLGKGNLEHESIKVNYRMAHIGMGDGRYLDER